MSEETKDIILDVKDSLNETPKNMYKYNKITLNLNEFEEILNYIEQLEKELKEANESITWWSNRFKAVERDNKQLENIRKEAIKFINEELEENGSHNVSGSDLPYDVIEDLLNILNKGSDK